MLRAARLNLSIASCFRLKDICQRGIPWLLQLQAPSRPEPRGPDWSRRSLLSSTATAPQRNADVFSGLCEEKKSRGHVVPSVNGMLWRICGAVGKLEIV